MRGIEYQKEVECFYKRTKDVFIVKRIEAGVVDYLNRATPVFTPPKGIDLWVLSSKYHNVALEIKYTDTDRFNFSRVTKHQLKILSSFEKSKCGRSFILLGFQNGDISILFNLKNYKLMRKQRLLEGKKSINIRLQKTMFFDYGSLHYRKKLVKNHYIDLSSLLIRRS